jgi:hypothetical protein
MAKFSANEPKPGPERLCFVIGPIGEAGSPTRKHADMLLNAIIKPTVAPLGYRVKRADEDPTPGMISDAVLIDLRDAELVVADLSELNPNAFYELGIRHARERPTVHMAVEGMRLPFDNAGYRAIRFDLSDWDSQQRARAELEAMIKITEAPGFRVTNPITHANAMFRVRESADPNEHVISEVLNRLTRLEQASTVDFHIRSNDDLMAASLKQQLDLMGSGASVGVKVARGTAFLKQLNMNVLRTGYNALTETFTFQTDKGEIFIQSAARLDTPSATMSLDALGKG